VVWHLPLATVLLTAARLPSFTSLRIVFTDLPEISATLAKGSQIITWSFSITSPTGFPFFDFGLGQSSEFGLGHFNPFGLGQTAGLGHGLGHFS
jgi:hypothetical protein